MRKVAIGILIGIAVLASIKYVSAQVREEFLRTLPVEVQKFYGMGTYEAEQVCRYPKEGGVGLYVCDVLHVSDDQHIVVFFDNAHEPFLALAVNGSVMKEMWKRIKT